MSQFTGCNKITIIDRVGLFKYGDLSKKIKKQIVDLDVSEVGILKIGGSWNDPVILLVKDQVIDLRNNDQLWFCEDDILNEFIEVENCAIMENKIKSYLGSELAKVLRLREEANDKMNFILSLNIL